MPYRQKIYSMQLSHYRMTGGAGGKQKAHIKTKYEHHKQY